MLRAPHINLAAQTGVMALFCLIFCSEVAAEIRTITATGEYRMGDNDTRTDAKRMALLDAKRLASGQAGTYLGGRNFQSCYRDGLLSPNLTFEES